jgi:hypothetical protein
MNDPQFVEASRNIAQRAMQKDESDEAIINNISQILLSRPMRDTELSVVMDLYQSALEEFKSAPDEAKKLLEVGESKADPKLSVTELAAWTIVANQILNMDETLNK